MNSEFESDPHPGRTKILFIGLAQSSHTHSWIDLLSDAEFNVRLFAMPGSLPPSDWQVKTYISRIKGTNNSIRQFLYHEPDRLMKSVYYKIITKIRLPPLSPEAWLANVIKKWKPDIIHTLGVFEGQGGEFYFNVRKSLGLENQGVWILQLRGGSDIALRRHNPETASHLLEIFNACDEIITDNYANIDYINELGMTYKVASIAPVPGTGGLNIDPIKEAQLPSKKERLILWPKAYESQWSKALPVLEAIELAWPKIQPCKIHMTAVTAETEAWFWTLPEAIRINCAMMDRIPRDELLALMKRARVLLIPSLVDGVPNSLYESMVFGTFPIVSPLETITPVVKNEENVLFARNLYPEEISAALVRAMSDDDLVDRAAQNNFRLVEQIASRSMIAEKVINYYQRLIG